MYSHNQKHVFFFEKVNVFTQSKHTGIDEYMSTRIIISLKNKTEDVVVCEYERIRSTLRSSQVLQRTVVQSVEQTKQEDRTQRNVDA